MSIIYGEIISKNQPYFLIYTIASPATDTLMMSEFSPFKDLNTLHLAQCLAQIHTVEYVHG